MRMTFPDNLPLEITLTKDQVVRYLEASGYRDFQLRSVPLSGFIPGEKEVWTCTSPLGETVHVADEISRVYSSDLAEFLLAQKKASSEVETPAYLPEPPPSASSNPEEKPFKFKKLSERHKMTLEEREEYTAEVRKEKERQKLDRTQCPPEFRWCRIYDPRRRREPQYLLDESSLWRVRDDIVKDTLMRVAAKLKGLTSTLHVDLQELASALERGEAPEGV